jgi:hypothetical protein
MSAMKSESRARHNDVRSRRLAGGQVKAIRLAAEIGDDIRKNYPEIAEEYRSGLTAPRMVAAHEFDRRYGVSRPAAIGAVRNAIRGYFGPYHEHYDGLIADRPERERLTVSHNSRTGTELYEQKRGIHAMTHEQRVAVGRKGGLIRGPLSYELRIGCHAMSPEVLREHCRRIAPLGGKAGAAPSLAARGLVPYTPATPERVAEIEFAVSLAADPRYLGPIRTNFKRIAEKVNEVFHSRNPRYTRTTLKIALQSRRRHDRSAIEFPEDQELSFAEKLTRDPAYQLTARIKGAEIARRVNEEYQGGRPVRNPLSIGDAIQRYRRQHAGLTPPRACASTGMSHYQGRQGHAGQNLQRKRKTAARPWQRTTGGRKHQLHRSFPYR